MEWKEITVCLDMHGCPNRCRHCWLGASPNGNMTVSDLEFAAQQFRPYTESLQIYDWYREPDFKEDYKEMFRLCNQLSHRPIEHFELISFWRLVRDKRYVEWLTSLGIKCAQLTLFGTEETTDFYVGRKGAYGEILEAIEILLQNKISPRIQVFVNKENIEELGHIEALLRSLQLESRCSAFGGCFSFFLHQGSCDGENEKWYDSRVTPEDLEKIPPVLKAYTLRHFGTDSLLEVFGKTERELCEELAEDFSTASYVTDCPVFYVDRDFNVYPNITAPAPHWRLGNLKTDGAETVLKNYAESSSLAQHVRLTVPLCVIGKAQGDKTSRRLFTKGDYITFLLNRYCRQ